MNARGSRFHVNDRLATTALFSLVHKLGSYDAVAALFGKKTSTLHNWLDNKVPAKEVQGVLDKAREHGVNV